MIGTARAANMSPKAWQQLPAAYGWDDLVLLPRGEEQLRAVADEFSVRCRDASAAQPNRPPGGKRGIPVLLSGPAGTGKTMAAQTLGRELLLGVIEADLTSVLTRERWRMARLFAIAARSRAVLVLDHVDTLIAGATDADGSDPAGTANDLSDLLERSRGHPGIVIFAMRPQPVADEAVLGHFDHVIEFPLPERAAREEIWCRQLANAGLGEADIAALASAITISGGEIAACCAAATRSAAHAGAPVQIDHVVHALERQCAGAPLSTSELEALELLRAPITPEPRGASDRGRPALDAQAKPTSAAPSRRKLVLPAMDGSSAAASARSGAGGFAVAAAAPAGEVTGSSNGVVAAPAPTRGGRRFSAGDALAGVTHARRWLIAGLTGIVVAAALGLALAGSSNKSTALPALDRHAAAGPVVVSYPSLWQKRAAASLPGLPLSHAVAFSPGGTQQGLLVLGTSQAAGPTLLPPRFVAALANPAGGQTLRLGSMWFYRFPNLSLRGDPRPASVYVLPTTAGVVTSVCRPPDNGFNAACERILAALTLRPGVQTLVTSPDYARSLSDVIARLNAVRVSASAQLAAARTATAQSRVESRLASAQAQAGSAIANLNAGPAQAANAALASALKMSSGAYAAMARAASRGDVAAYRAASSSLARASAAARSASADLEQFGYHIG